MSSVINPIEFKNDKLYLLDQRYLPHEELIVELDSLEKVHDAIRDMIVRGAPCIGFSAIYGMAVAVLSFSDFTFEKLSEAGKYLVGARPTAVNLQYEIDQVLKLILTEKIIDKKKAYLRICEYGNEQIQKSEIRNRAMAKIAEKELNSTLSKKSYNILTHCNTGFLACGSIGTALGVIQNLQEVGKLNKVWVDETRPYMQGTRLTAYELSKLGVEYEIVTEGCASYLMKNALVDAVFTGADRIVENGDTANKVGTSNLSILCRYYNIPFYIVAPSSSFDLNTPSGEKIEVELRDEVEILEYSGKRIAPLGAKAFNPSFDITDGKLITGIISENGIAKGDYTKTLREIVIL